MHDTFVCLTCAACGMHFALDHEFFYDRLQDRQPFMCPAGHLNRCATRVAEQDADGHPAGMTHEQRAATRASIEHLRKMLAQADAGS